MITLHHRMHSRARIFLLLNDLFSTVVTSILYSCYPGYCSWDAIIVSKQISHNNDKNVSGNMQRSGIEKSYDAKTPVGAVLRCKSKDF